MRLLFVVLLSSVSASAVCHSPGKARWPIKSSVPEKANFARAKNVDLTDLMQLVSPPGVKHGDARYQSKRIASFDNDLKLKEGDFVSVKGYLYLIATEENDCEYHIQISDQPRTTTNKPTSKDLCLIVELPKPEDLEDPELKKRAQATREFIRTRLLEGNEPGSSGNVMRHPVYVKVSGQLFFDDAHLKSDGSGEPRGKKKMSSATLWELHPIYAMQFAPKPR